MAKKESTSTEIEDIKKALAAKTAVIGTERSIKSLKLGKLSRVFLTSNCPSSVEKDIEHYAKLSGTEVVKLEIPNDELGTVCKKPFPISVISIQK